MELVAIKRCSRELQYNSEPNRRILWLSPGKFLDFFRRLLDRQRGPRSCNCHYVWSIRVNWTPDLGPLVKV